MAFWFSARMSRAEAPSTRARFICRDSGDTIRGQQGRIPDKLLSCCRKHPAPLCRGEGSQGTQEGSEAVRDPPATKHRPGPPRFGQQTPQVTALWVCDLQTLGQPPGQAGDRARQRGKDQAGDRARQRAQGQAKSHLGDNGSGEGLLLGTSGALGRLLGAHGHHPNPAVGSAQLWLHVTHLGTWQGEGELGCTPRFRAPPKHPHAPRGPGEPGTACGQGQQLGWHREHGLPPTASVPLPAPPLCCWPHPGSGLPALVSPPVSPASPPTPSAS